VSSASALSSRGADFDRESDVKIEDVMEIMEINLREADEAVKDSGLSQAARNEALGAKKAYAHCLGLLNAALLKKGWK
jgi:hypothetical protein